jgi:hypothetical protein
VPSGGGSCSWDGDDRHTCGRSKKDGSELGGARTHEKGSKLEALCGEVWNGMSKASLCDTPRRSGRSPMYGLEGGEARVRAPKSRDKLYIYQESSTCVASTQCAEVEEQPLSVARPTCATVEWPAPLHSHSRTLTLSVSVSSFSCLSTLGDHRSESRADLHTTDDDV